MNGRTVSDIGNFIFMSDKPISSDIIMIPGCSTPEVAEFAADLWHRGMAPYILPSGRYSIKRGSFLPPQSKCYLYNKPYLTECEFFCDVLKLAGVPDSAIIKEDMSSYTMENAVFSKQILDSMGINITRAIICAKSYHARRCYMYYSEVFRDAEIFVCTVDIPGVSKDNWFLTERGIGRVMGELEKCGSQFASLFAEDVRTGKQAIIK